MSSADRIAARQHNGLFLIQCRINDVFAARFIVDTGATLTVLSRAYASMIGLTQAPMLRQEPIITAQNITTAPVIQLEKLQVGGVTASQGEAAILPLPEQLRVQGLLGASFLRRFRVTFEYDTSTLILRPL